MRIPLSLLVLTSLAACSKSSEDLQAPMVREEPMMPDSALEQSAADRGVTPPPAIAPTAAPGVAFNYRYAFRLPFERIAAVQEQHAQACEKLGIDRCRITGMRYRLVNDRDIEAMLAFKLEPSLARSFGKQGIDAVGQAEGMLVDSAISGEDVGSQIDAGERNAARMREDLERIEAELRKPGLKASERSELQRQADRLRSAIRAGQASQDERRESLATTPMVFAYGSGDLAPGFDTRPSVARALERAGDNFIDGVSLLLVILVSLLPWAAVLALAIWLFRLIGRKFGLGRWPAPEAA